MGCVCIYILFNLTFKAYSSMVFNVFSVVQPSPQSIVDIFITPKASPQPLIL